jgi:hypothetical protein
MALLTLIWQPPALAGLDPNWQNPEAKFTASKNATDTKQITWRHTDNVQKECEAESHKRKLGGFGYAVNACSFWDSATCTIITAQQATMHTLGHEVRHCFQGNFH